MDILRQSSSTRENLSLLSMLEVLENGECITQRELALATGLNLKKVNYSLHKLLEKGYVKFQRIRNSSDKRKYLYILTPAGLKAKSQLTYSFLKFTLDFYNRMEEKLSYCLEEMQNAGVNRVVLYGANDVARILMGLAHGKEPSIAGLVDDDYLGQEFHGGWVIKTDELLRHEWDGVFITALEAIDEVEARLIQLGVPENAIWKLL
jgi:DNA-binding MarR family transcriptional regulator